MRDEFRSPVLLHRPSNLDTAYVLAQLQEEVSGRPSALNSGSLIRIIIPKRQPVQHYHCLLHHLNRASLPGGRPMTRSHLRSLQRFPVLNLMMKNGRHSELFVGVRDYVNSVLRNGRGTINVQMQSSCT